MLNLLQEALNFIEYQQRVLEALNEVTIISRKKYDQISAKLAAEIAKILTENMRHKDGKNIIQEHRYATTRSKLVEFRQRAQKFTKTKNSDAQACDDISNNSFHSFISYTIDDGMKNWSSNIGDNSNLHSGVSSFIVIDEPARALPRLAKIKTIRTLNDSAKTLDDPSKTPNDSAKTLDDPSKTPNDLAKTLDDPSKTPNESAKTFEDPSKTPNDSAKTLDKSTKTSDDSAKSLNDSANILDDSLNTINNNPQCESAEMSDSLGEDPGIVSQLNVKIPDKIFKCDICDRTFSRMKYLRVHGITHVDVKIHDCDNCGAKFKTKSSLTRHYKLHRGIYPHICDVCGKKFPIKDYLDKHLVSHNRYKKHEKNFVCDICGKGFLLNYKLKEHQAWHNGKPFKCSICPKEYDSKSSLSTHVKNSHKNSSGKTAKTKKFRCGICSKIFTTKLSLENHEFLHTGKRPIACDLCDKNFPLKCYLDTHKRYTHATEKKFKCNICGLKLKKASSLKVHSLLHTGEKRFQCKVCKRKFAQKGDCKKHESIHTRDTQSFIS